jgi:2-oxoglutarate dehydrogenase E2 component (dihydrolipoamide succinyltransferase)
MIEPFVLPALGEGVEEVTITRWLKRVGDSVKPNETLLEVETDKITTEVVADRGGALVEIKANEGDKVRVGSVVAIVGDNSEADARRDESNSSDTRVINASIAIDNPKSKTEKLKYTGRISPVVSRMVAEHGIDINQIVGTGEGGRITKQDVVAHIQRSEGRTNNSDSQTTIDDSRSTIGNSQNVEDVEILPLTTMRKRIAEHMVSSVRTSPHVTTVWEFDFSEVAAHRSANKVDFSHDGINLTWLAYVVHATSSALKLHRMVNSQWREDGIALMREINIGMATALQDGLIVPVIARADELNLKGIARKIGELASKARGKQLSPNDTQGGTFTITNHGIAGSLLATPIINQPQCGILGFGAVEKRVKVVTLEGNDAIAIRPCAYMSFTFDHRILDGASADAFMKTIQETIEGWHTIVSV